MVSSAERTERRRSPLARALARESFVVVASLVAVTGLAWYYTLSLSAGMRMGGMDMAGYRMVPVGLRMAMVPVTGPWKIGRAHV